MVQTAQRHDSRCSRRAVPRGRVTIAILCFAGALAIAGCSGQKAKPVPASPGSTEGAETQVVSGNPDSPGPTATAAPTPTPVDLSKPTAWSQFHLALGSDGFPTKASAIQAAAIAFGPIPAIDLPDGRSGGGISGSEPYRWLLHYWNDLGPDLQKAFASKLPELVGVTNAGGGSGHSVRSVGDECGFVDSPNAGSYRTLVDGFVKQIATGLGRGLSVQTSVCLTTAPAKVFAWAALWSSNGRLPACRISMSPAGRSLGGVDLRFVLAHEIFHCFEQDIETYAQALAAPPWVQEGEATWVGLTLGGATELMTNEGDPTNVGHWRGWLQHPEVPLFARWYDSIGFYALIQSLGADVWKRLDPMVQVSDPTSAYQIAVAGLGDEVGKRWASTGFRESAPADAWDLPAALGITSKSSAPPPIHSLAVANGATVSTDQFSAFAAGLYQVSGGADVVTLQATGYSRVADAGSLDQAPGNGATVNLCLKSGGCKCPADSEGQPTTQTTAPIRWAVGGGHVSGQGTAVGYSLDDWCKKKATPTPRLGLDGTWNGSWHNVNVKQESGGFRLEWKQSGQQLAGTIQVFDTSCLTDGTVTGAVSGNTLTFGVVQGQVTIVYTGTWSGSNMSGTYQASPSCASAAGNWAATRE